MPSILLAIKHAALDAHNARVRARIAAEAADDPNTTAGATAGGDERKLRGIPAIGRGVPGHVPGSHPLDALRRLIRNERDNDP